MLDTGPSGAAGHLPVQQLEALHGVPRPARGRYRGRRGDEVHRDLVAGDGADEGGQESSSTVDVPGDL